MANKRRDSKNRILKTGESERPDGRYAYYYTDPRTKKRKTVYGKDLKDLRKKEEEIQDKFSVFYGLSDDEITLKNFVERNYIVEYGEFNSIKSRKSKKRYIIESDLANIKIKDIAESDCKRFVVELGAKYAKSTVMATCSTLKSLFETAVKQRIIALNPMDFNYSSFLSEGEDKSRIISDDEFEILISYCYRNFKFKRFTPYLIVLRETGMRIGEFCGLTIDEIDLNRRIISIRQQFQQEGKKGGVIKKPKTKTSTRIIPITHRCEQALKEILNTTPLVIEQKEIRYSKNAKALFEMLMNYDYHGSGDVTFTARELKCQLNLTYNPNAHQIRKQIVEKSMKSLRTVFPGLVYGYSPASSFAEETYFRFMWDREILTDSQIKTFDDGRFLTGKSGSPLIPESMRCLINELIDEYNAEAEVKIRRITPHDFRRTAATRNIYGGISPKSVQALLGHSTSKTTMDIYTKMIQDEYLDEFYRNDII